LGHPGAQKEEEMKFTKEFDKTEIMKAVIEPLTKQLWEACKANGIPLVVLLQGSAKVDKTGEGFDTHIYSTVTLGEEGLMVDYGLIFASILTNDVVNSIAQSTVEEILTLNGISETISGVNPTSARKDANLIAALFGPNAKEGGSDNGPSSEDC
jgi:uncharacterized protein YaaW (UPF0174 family)